MLNLSDPRGYLELWEAAAHRRKTGYDGTFTSVCNRLQIYVPEIANPKLFFSKSHREGLPRSNPLREVSSDNHLNDGRGLQEASYDDFEIMDCSENHPLHAQEYIWLFPSLRITNILIKTKQKRSSSCIYRAGSTNLPYLLS